MEQHHNMEQLFDVLTRSRSVSNSNRQSKAASMTLSMKEWAEKQRQDAKCAKTIKTIVRNSLGHHIRRNRDKSSTTYSRLHH